nr:hypothetical protein [Candidatus Omnitrophota bacterium]
MFPILKKIHEEFWRIIPAVIYFFFAFSLFNLTFGMWLKEMGLRIWSFTGVVIAALIVGKVMLIVDSIPFLNIFSNKPLIYSTVWKSLVYTFVSFLIRLLEKFIPLLRQGLDIGSAWARLIEGVLWPRFWTIQIWCFILFLVFVVNQELIKGIGWERI